MSKAEIERPKMDSKSEGITEVHDLETQASSAAFGLWILLIIETLGFVIIIASIITQSSWVLFFGSIDLVLSLILIFLVREVKGMTLVGGKRKLKITN